MNTLHVTSCCCCGGSELFPVLDLGQQPLANQFVATPSERPTFPLELCVCSNCFHNQLSVIVPPGAMFRHYLYVSGTSRTLRHHFAELADEAPRWLGRKPGR